VQSMYVVAKIVAAGLGVTDDKKETDDRFRTRLIFSLSSPMHKACVEAKVDDQARTGSMIEF
jgi:hypothetical protein